MEHELPRYISIKFTMYCEEIKFVIDFSISKNLNVIFSLNLSTYREKMKTSIIGFGEKQTKNKLMVYLVVD